MFFPIHFIYLCLYLLCETWKTKIYQNYVNTAQEILGIHLLSARCMTTNIRYIYIHDSWSTNNRGDLEKLLHVTGSLDAISAHLWNNSWESILHCCNTSQLILTCFTSTAQSWCYLQNPNYTILKTQTLTQAPNSVEPIFVS